MCFEEIMERRIVCAAVRFSDGLVVCAPRHFHAIHFVQQWLKGRPPVTYGDGEQGFVDQQGVFLTREEAWEVAHAAGQIIRTVGKGESKKLFSENLY